MDYRVYRNKPKSYNPRVARTIVNLILGLIVVILLHQKRLSG